MKWKSDEKVNREKGNMAEKFARGSPLTPVEFKESNNDYKMWGSASMKGYKDWKEKMMT